LVKIRRKVNLRSSRFYSFVGALFLLTLSACPSWATLIRVGILRGVSSATISGTSLRASAGGNAVSVPASFTVAARGNSLVVHGKTVPSPLIVTSQQLIRCGKMAYEGELVVRAQGSRLTVVNKIDLEKYLRGVLGFEISPTWALEVLKAQAVISRTYALSQMGRHGSEGFDVCDSDHCQVYKGANVHDGSTDQAIIQTRGQVIVYNGALARTFFSSDSGGATSDVRDVWGTAEPYLVVRREPFRSQSPRSEWETEVSAAEIQSALAKKGKSVGRLHQMAIVRRDSAGRPTLLRFTGSTGAVELPSAMFRMLIGAKKVRSTFFEFRKGAPMSELAVSEPAELDLALTRQKMQQPSAFLPIAENDASPLTAEEETQLKALIGQKKFSVDERLDMLMNPKRKRAYLSKALGKNAPEPAEEKQPVAVPPASSVSTPPVFAAERQTVSSCDASHGVKLYGRGWGHGVGLSQWGAKAMADHGWSAEKILSFYYPGTTLQKR